MRSLFALIFVLAGFIAQAQTVSVDTSSVIVHKDQRLDVMVKKQAEINLALKKANARTMKGFRLLVINTNKRDDAIAAKSKIYQSFPELKSYLIYQSPYFKLKAGNFKTRDEALQYQKFLSPYFPKGVFVIMDIIEVTPEKEE